MRKVLKFGGSSLADAGQVNKAAALIQAETERRYVVVSAPGKRFPQDQKITDLLYACAELAQLGQSIAGPFAAVEERYQGICRDLGLTGLLDAELSEINTAIQNGAGRDYAASRGEYLSGKVMAARLGVPFVDAAELMFFRADGSLDEGESCRAIARRLKNLERAVIPGFYGVLPDGRIKTFSRGGSDISGAVVAKGINADLYENWTDVSGMLMADPRIVEAPRVIRELSYEELEKLARMGAAVMHPEAVAPARSAGIPIHILNTNAPEEPGTWISAGHTALDQGAAITGVAGRTGFSTIAIAKKSGLAGAERQVRMVLREAQLRAACLSSGADGRLFVVVPTEAVERCRDSVSASLQRSVRADAVTIEDGIALLGVVGRAARQAAGRLTEAMEREDIPVRMVDRSSRKDLLLGVREADYLRAFQAVYRAALCC